MTQTTRLPYLPLALGIVFTLSATATAQEPAFMVDFRDPSHRAVTMEDGLEFLRVEGPWALYLVTSDTPRIYFPHALQPDPVDQQHGIRICGSSGYFTAEYDQLVEDAPSCGRNCTPHVGMVHLKLAGSVGGVPQEIASSANGAKPFDTCRQESDRGGWFNTTEVIDELYLAIEPAPPLGSVIPLRMVALGNGLTQENHERPPVICCHDEFLCQAGGPPDVPPEPPGGGGSDGGTEPPGDGGSDGGTEPPGGGGTDGGTEPPGGGGLDGGPIEPPGPTGDGGDDFPVEPPGISNPPPPGVCTTAPHRTPSGGPLYFLALALGVVLTRRARAEARGV